MPGSQAEAYFNAGQIQDIADYCKSDVINTYRLWLRHELFRGRLDQIQFVQRAAGLPDIAGPVKSSGGVMSVAGGKAEDICSH
jgi:Predicted 3'-5' exonuclease related to the exonuclease domain of PolB